MKLAASILLVGIAGSAFGYFFWYRPTFTHPASNTLTIKSKNDDARLLLKLKANAAAIEEYAGSNNYNTSYCFLIDMSIPSGKARFFVYNLDKDSAELSGLVAHGTGTNKGGAELYFSNTPNSNCTSLGRYSISKSYYGRFGLAYKLYGLDKTNSKAFERFIVLHAHNCVPDHEVAPVAICESLGCPMVAPGFLTELKTYIDGSEKPILMWIYY